MDFWLEFWGNYYPVQDSSQFNRHIFKLVQSIRQWSVKESTYRKWCKNQLLVNIIALTVLSINHRKLEKYWSKNYWALSLCIQSRLLKFHSFGLASINIHTGTIFCSRAWITQNLIFGKDSGSQRESLTKRTERNRGLLDSTAFEHEGIPLVKAPVCACIGS